MIYRLFLALALLSSSSAWAGVFLCSTSDVGPCCDCTPSGCDPCNTFIIVHPVGYTSAGIGGEIEIPICIRPGDAPFVQPALVEAIEIWNGLTPTTGNCTDCASADDPNPPGVARMITTMAHELGHCAIGLEHSNFQAGPGSPLDNFTAGTGITSYDDGADNIRGSGDDVATPPPSPPPPSAVLNHWFRKSDNNPVIIDGTVIDSSTFSKINSDLPAGSTWPASANRYVADLLGAGDNTQSVMHGVAARDMVYSGLTADDTNTTRHGMSGLDATAGTGDDYTIKLTLVDDCADAEIEVLFDPLGAGELGLCEAELVAIDPTMPPLGWVHHAVIPDPFLGIIRVTISSGVSWDVMFFDGFESGDLSSWSTP